MLKSAKQWIVGVFLMGMAMLGFAQTTPTDYGAVAAITSTQSTVLSIIAGFITMGIAVWGAMYILRRFFPKGR